MRVWNDGLDLGRAISYRRQRSRRRDARLGHETQRGCVAELFEHVSADLKRHRSRNRAGASCMPIRMMQIKSLMG